MQIINRFIQKADQMTEPKVDLSKVFFDATEHEIDHVLQALYIIANRRVDAGHPVQLEEIASAIPELMDDDCVLEAAVEISIDGMIATGQKPPRQSEELSTQLRELAEAKLMQTPRAQPRRTESGLTGTALPRYFGPLGLDGKPRYELRRVLGSGNQGIVYEAVDHVFTDANEPVFVALKVFYEDASNRMGSSEGKVARKIRHRHIASVTDQGVTDSGESYVAYELVLGLPLDDWMRKNNSGCSLSDRLRIAIKIAQGVQAAHAAGVVHRDLKPSNILIDAEGEPVVTDFGIASTKHSDATMIGRYGTRGSLAFMAPEQYQGKAARAAPLVDVYAIGGILYWMLSSRFPNGDKVADAVDWLEHHDQGGPQRIGDHFEDKKIRTVLMRCLALDPAERYQSAEAIAINLGSILDRIPIVGVDDDAWSRARLFARRNKLLTTMYAVLLLFITGFVALIIHNEYKQRFIVKSMNYAAEIEALNSQVEVEQARLAAYMERMDLARTMLGSWMKTLDAEASETAVLFNLLFLHSQATDNPLVDTQEFRVELMDRRLEVAIAHAESLDPATTSPIERALWFEMIAGWVRPTNPERADSYLQRAHAIVEQFAPDDSLWLMELSGTPSSHPE